MVDQADPERLPARRILTHDTGERNGTWMGEVPDVLTAAEARAMVLHWTDGRSDPGPAGAEFDVVAGRWGRRLVVWRLGADGRFHLESDRLVDR